MRIGQGSGWTIQSGPTLAIWAESAPGHMRLVRPSQVKGSRGGNEGSRGEGEEEEEEGDGLKLKGEALASASGQASRCGDPGLFELK